MGYFYIYFMEEEVIKLYTTTIISMREIAVIYDTNHKVIGKILKKNNIPTRDGNKGKKRSDETKRLISKSGKGRVNTWNKGKKASYEQNMKNMYAKLNRPLLTFEKLCMFDDFEKLKFLNRAIAKYRNEFDDIRYIGYLDKFWNCDQFNKVYNKWLENGKSKWMKPSVDHIIPSSIGGTYDLDNLQFLSWFENRAKNDMSMDEWNHIKNNIKDYLT